MGSRSIETRENQKARYEKLAEVRSSALREKGLTDEQVRADPKIKHLKAKVKQIGAAMVRISFVNEQTRQLKEKKEQKKAEAEAARAAAIAGQPVEPKKKEEEKKAQPGKKAPASGKAPAKAKAPAKKKGK